MVTMEVELDHGAVGKGDLGFGVPEKCFVPGVRIDSICMGSPQPQNAEHSEETKVEAAV